jgi:hypothetical protein
MYSWIGSGLENLPELPPNLHSVIWPLACIYLRVYDSKQQHLNLEREVVHEQISEIGPGGQFDIPDLFGKMLRLMTFLQ